MRFLLSITNEQIPSIFAQPGQTHVDSSHFLVLLSTRCLSGLTMSHFSFPHLVLSNYLPLLFLLLLFLLLLFLLLLFLLLLFLPLLFFSLLFLLFEEDDGSSQPTREAIIIANLDHRAYEYTSKYSA